MNSLNFLFFYAGKLRPLNAKAEMQLRRVSKKVVPFLFGEAKWWKQLVVSQTIVSNFCGSVWCKKVQLQKKA